MNIEEMTESELNALEQAIQDRRSQIAQERLSNHEQNKVEVYEAISTLEALRGPENPEYPSMEDLLAGNVSIREVRLFSGEDLGAHAGLALQLVLAGMEVMANTQIALAKIESRRS